MRPGLNPHAIHHPSAIEHIIEFRPEWIVTLEVKETKGRTGAIIERARSQKIRVLENRTRGPAEPLTAYLKDFPYADLTDLTKGRRLIALDHIQDPQNFGAICRSAEAFGIDGAVFPKDRSSTITPAVIHASAGAVATLPICKVTNLAEALRKLKEEGFWIIGSELAPEAQAPWQVPDFDKWVFVVGAEGDGMSPLIKKLCDCLVQIPLKGKVQSLNASAATSALLYELTRPKDV